MICLVIFKIVFAILWFLLQNNVSAVNTVSYYYGQEKTEKTSWVISMENGYYFSGKQASYVSADVIPFAAKISFSGTLLWNSNREINTASEVYVAKSMNGGCIINSISNTIPKNVFLVKFADNGSFEWEKILNDGTDWYRLNFIISLNNGDFLFTASLTGFASCIYKFNENSRTVISEKCYSFPNEIIRLAELPNNYVACISYQGAIYGIYILLDDNGEIVIFKTEIKHSTGGNIFKDFKYTLDGNIFIVGETMASGLNKYGWLVKMNTLGNIIWSKTYNSLIASRFYGIKEMENGNLILVGTTANPDPISTWVLITTIDGKSLDQLTITDPIGLVTQNCVAVNPLNSGNFVVAGSVHLSTPDDNLLAVFVNYGACTRSTYLDTMSRECRNCPLFCDKCANENTCMQCIDHPGVILKNGLCECSIYRYFLTAENDCIKCHPLCDSCFGSTNNECYTCINDLRISKISKTCNCTDGFWYNPNEEKCVPCNPLCKKCHGPTEYECDSCDYPNSYEIENTLNLCVFECPDGFYRSYDICKSAYFSLSSQ